jgi:hypothetical protein
MRDALGAWMGSTVRGRSTAREMAERHLAVLGAIAALTFLAAFVIYVR